MMRALLIGLAGLALAACEAPPAPDTGAPTPPPTQAPQWAFALGVNSVELAWLTDAATAEAPLRMICARVDGFMVAATFKHIESEERLSVGAGGDAFALVAVAAEGSGGPFVKATGPIEESLLAAIESGQPISASYGAQTFGPVEAPPEAMRRAFADTCRKLAGGTRV